MVYLIINIRNEPDVAVFYFGTSYVFNIFIICHQRILIYYVLTTKHWSYWAVRHMCNDFWTKQRCGHPRRECNFCWLSELFTHTFDIEYWHSQTASNKAFRKCYCPLRKTYIFIAWRYYFQFYDSSLKIRLELWEIIKTCWNNAM